MDKVLYVAMTAAKETQFRQSVNANNIANVNSEGFKRQVVATRALESVGDGLKTRTYAMTHTAGIDASEGAIKFTGDKSDITVRGNDWFVLSDGDGEYLSKNIKLETNQFGEIVHSNGSKIITDQGNVVIPPEAMMQVSELGELYLKFPEQPQLAKVADLQIVTAESSLVRKNTKGQIVAVNPLASIQPSVVEGALQQSNINQVALAMDSMNLSNQFSMNMKIFESAKSMTQSTNKLIGN